MAEKVEMLEAKVQHMKEQNRTLRMMLEIMSKKCQKLQLHVQEMNNAEGSNSGQSEFSTAQKASQIFVKIHPNDNSLMVKDGYEWKKYGHKKTTKDNPSPRAYYKCALAPTCPVKKKVQRSIQDKSVVVATYEGKHNHGFPFRDLFKPSSATPEASIMDNDLPMTNISNDINIDLCLCNRVPTDVTDKQQKDGGSNIKVLEYVNSLLKDPNFIAPLAEAVVLSINSQSEQVGLNLSLGLPQSDLSK
ncbi:hypothetical protein V8G54_008297 [Vigna mungo]|uniref:WRKY domain-containing protein n=1 Tax=Vigna mungo TaxID=3915 RepID=A0AAQ3P3K0_VIGMU